MSVGPGVPLLIIDGYNVIGADPSLRTRLDDDADAARAELVEAVAGFAAGVYEPLVVFDAAASPTSDGTPHVVAGVTVVFSPAGQEADAVIEAWAHGALADERTVVLVTSDAETQRVVARPGVTRTSARLFWEEMREGARQTSRSSASAVRSRIEDRIDPSIREALMRWARGI